MDMKNSKEILIQLDRLENDYKKMQKQAVQMHKLIADVRTYLHNHMNQ